MNRRIIVRILATAAITSVFGFCGCNRSSRVLPAASPVASTTSSEPDPSAQEHASLTQQKMCADQAKKAFDDAGVSTKSKGYIDSHFNSHFDAKANVCYVGVYTATTLDGGKTMFDNVVVFDAFEGRTYASYSWHSDAVKKFWEVKPLECSVKPRGMNEISCASSDEFNSLIDKYFGIAD